MKKAYRLQANDQSVNAGSLLRENSNGNLWSSADVVNFLRICPRKFAYLRAQGEMVPPIAKIGRSLRFSPEEVQAWVQAGCPSTSEWITMKKA